MQAAEAADDRGTGRSGRRGGGARQTAHLPYLWALIEAEVVARYARIDLLVLDELAYVPLAQAEAELLFQVLDSRAEVAAIVVTTNLPFSEWTSVFPDPRLCKAIVDRLTFNAHIIETGIESWRLGKTMQTRQRKGGSTKKKGSPRFRGMSPHARREHHVIGELQSKALAAKLSALTKP